MTKQETPGLRCVECANRRGKDRAARWYAWFAKCGMAYTYLCDKCLIKKRDELQGSGQDMVCARPIGYEKVKDD
jgi:hypothetical protein